MSVVARLNQMENKVSGVNKFVPSSVMIVKNDGSYWVKNEKGQLVKPEELKPHERGRYYVVLPAVLPEENPTDH